MKKKEISTAMLFIILFGIVSLFSDMTHEGASSLRGAYLTLLGASSGAIGFISGLGELVGYSMRYVFGKITDKTKKYWPMVIFGYILDILAVPALALVGEKGWIAAAFLLVVQRMGKAIKKTCQRYYYVLCGISRRRGKILWHTRNARSNWSLFRSSFSISRYVI